MATAQRVLAVLLATISAGCMFAAVIGMIDGRIAGRPGMLLRVVAVVCFAGAVAVGTTHWR